MLTIIHGDDVAASRKYLFEQKTKDSLSFDGEKVTLTDLVQIFDGGNLFFEEKKVFIENFFSKKKNGKELDDIVDYFKKKVSGNEVFFWEGKELSKKYLNLFKNPIIKTFKLPQTLFLFLDNIKPKNGKEIINLFHKTLSTIEPELIFFMLIRQFRLLLALSCNFEPRPTGEKSPESNEQIDEVKNMAPWQKSKLLKQADFFKIDELKNIYKKLYQIDFEQKTGQSPLSLTQSIDFLLLDI